MPSSNGHNPDLKPYGYDPERAMKLVAEAKARGLSVGRAERVLREALSLATMPNRGGRYSTLLLPDPDAVFRHRAAIAKAIERLAHRLGK